MGWDGSGAFTRNNGTQTGSTTWADADAAGNDITTSQHDTHDEDLADGIQACLTKNNETKPTADFKPNADATYSFGSSALRWVNLWLSGALKFYASTFTGTVAMTPTADRTITIPDATGTVVLRDTNDTLTNKTISGASNTLTVRDTDLSFSDNTTNDVSTTKHGLVPKAPNDTTKFLRGDGTWNTAGSVWTTVKKTANESVNNAGTGATFQDDAELTFPVAANTSYSFRIHVFYTTNASADIKFQLTGPAAATLAQASLFAATGSGIDTVETATAFSTAWTVLDTGTAGHAVIDGILHNGINAGSVTLQWAQNSANAADTTVYKGSYLEHTTIS
jgi:hypothetical protein